MLTQIQCINKIINNNDYQIISDNNLTEDYFPNFTSEFRFILNHYKTYNQLPDMATFLKSFPDFEVLEVKESTNYLVDELYREKNESFLVNTFNKMKDYLVAGKTQEAMDLFTSSSHNMSDSKRMEAVEILSDISRYDTYVDKCNNLGQYYLPTGFEELDDSLGGGIDRKNSYFIISARPGIGKTLVMVKFASTAVRKGLRVGLYEGEMSVDKIAGRYDTLTSHISNGLITHGNISVSTEYKKYLENLSSSVKGKFYVLTRDMISENKVTVQVLENFIDKYNLDVLFVDQLSLLDSTLKNGRSFEQLADISKSIKNLQVRKHIPIIVASQLNREATDELKAVGTENIAGSDRIAQDATEIISLSKKDSIMTLDITKARDGAKKYKLKYNVDFDKGVFTYIPDDNETSYSSDSYNDEDEEEVPF